jgi:hypothetical protein
MFLWRAVRAWVLTIIATKRMSILVDHRVRLLKDGVLQHGDSPANLPWHVISNDLIGCLKSLVEEPAAVQMALDILDYVRPHIEENIHITH